MMQRITIHHVLELDDNQKQSLRAQWIPQEGQYIAFNKQEEMIYFLAGVEKDKSLPLLTIGQMIELLKRKEASLRVEHVEGEWIVSTPRLETRGEELCDALWAAAKELI